MNLNKDNIKKIIFIIIVGILAYTVISQAGMVYGALLWIVRLVFPFLLGGAIAFIINVPMRAIERMLFGHYSGKHTKLIQKIRRPVSFITTLICILGVLCLAVLFVAPQLGDTIETIIAGIPAFINRTQADLNRLVNEYQWLADEIGNIQIDWSSITAHLTGFLKDGVSNIFTSTIGIASSIVSGVVTFFVAFFFAIYILFQKEKLSSQCKKLLYAYLPEKRSDRIIEISKMSNRIFSKFLSGQCLEAMILGTMFFIALTIFRFPYALLIGVLVAFTALIPIVGAFIGCAVGALLMLMVSPTEMILFIILFLVLQQIEGNFIYPKVVGNSIGLPALWVLAAVSIGGSLWGIAGMLILIPLASVIYTLLREFAYKRLNQRKINPKKYQ